MNTNRVTVRYAKALYSFASEENKSEAVRQDMHVISELVKIPEFKSMLENPVIFPSKKTAAFNEILKNKADSITFKFFELLTKNKREIYLSAIARNYIELYRKKNGIKSAKLVTTYTADQQLLSEVSTILSNQFRSKIELNSDTNKNITGGFVLTVDGLQYDASVATKLKEIKREMLKAEE